MAYITVDADRRILHAHTHRKPRGSPASGHAVHEWPDSLGTVPIGHVVTLRRGKIHSAAGPAIPDAEHLLQARETLLAVALEMWPHRDALGSDALTYARLWWQVGWTSRADSGRGRNAARAVAVRGALTVPAALGVQAHAAGLKAGELTALRREWSSGTIRTWNGAAFAAPTVRRVAAPTVEFGAALKKALVWDWT